MERPSLYGFILNISCMFTSFYLAYRGFADIYLRKYNKIGSDALGCIKDIKIAILVSVNVLVIYILTVETSDYDKSEILYILLQILLIASLCQSLVDVTDRLKSLKVADKVKSSNTGTYKELIRELDELLNSIERREILMFRHFKKVSSLKRIEKYGLNIHCYTVCFTINQLIEACEEYKYMCTIRTDMKESSLNYGHDYPFYIIQNKIEVDADKLKREIFDKEYIAIVTNALQYDKYLKYNLVISLARNGDFMAEYSFENTPLRCMYKHSENLNCVTGNINDNIRLWDRTYLRKDNKLDLRILKDILEDNYLIAEQQKLFDRYIEMSVYKQKCGILNKEIVYWEI